MPSLRFPTDLIHRISLERLHALFAAHGYPPNVTPKTTSLAAIAEALASPALPARLAAALRTLRTLAPDADALVDAALDRKRPIEHAEPHVDRVARTLADDPRDKHGVVARALLHVRRSPASAPYRLYLGTGAAKGTFAATHIASFAPSRRSPSTSAGASRASRMRPPRRT